MIVKQYWKEIAILGLCLFILTMRFGPLQPEPEVLERVQVEYRDKVQVVYKDRIVYKEKVTTKPDGTRIEERTESREQTKEENTENNKKQEVVVLEHKTKPRYTLGLTYDPFNNQYNAVAGIRIADLPIFAQVSLHGLGRLGLGVGIAVELSGN